jgi:hypothetical protein
LLFTSHSLTHSINNPTQLITDLNNIKTDPDLKLASFDINNMYSNIPTTELIYIIAQASDQHSLPQNIKHELISLSDNIIAQNYFCYQDKTYVQTKGLTKEAPTSSLFSEIYLQHLKATQIVNNLLQHHIIGYFQYVDDILIVYKQDLTNIQDVLKKFNSLTP